MYFPSADNTTCSVKQIGDSCTSDAECQFGMVNSICDGSGVCACDTGYYHDTAIVPDTCVLRLIGKLYSYI